MKGTCISVAEQAIGEGQILGSTPSPVSDQVGSMQLGNWSQKLVCKIGVRGSNPYLQLNH